MSAVPEVKLTDSLDFVPARFPVNLNLPDARANLLADAQAPRQRIVQRVQDFGVGVLGLEREVPEDLTANQG